MDKIYTTKYGHTIYQSFQLNKKLDTKLIRIYAEKFKSNLLKLQDGTSCMPITNTIISVERELQSTCIAPISTIDDRAFLIATSRLLNTQPQNIMWALQMTCF